MKMTKWIWPKSVNMIENLTTANVVMVNLTKIIINIATMTNLSMWMWSKIKIIVPLKRVNFTIFGHIQAFIFIIVMTIKYFSIFGQIQSFLVTFKDSMFVVVNVVHVQAHKVPRFWSYSTTTFGHLHLVKLTSLYWMCPSCLKRYNSKILSCSY